jgi:hypothetical protein
MRITPRHRVVDEAPARTSLAKHPSKRQDHRGDQPRIEKAGPPISAAPRFGAG